MQNQTTYNWKSIWAMPLYVALSLLLLPYLKNVITPDDVSYIRIAERYAEGNFAEAINGYWSPLSSWLGALFSSSSIPALYLYKYILIANGCIVVLLVSILFWRLGLKKSHQLYTSLGIIPLLLNITYQQLCGDFFQLSFLLLYIIVVLSPRYGSNIFSAIAAAVFCVFAFYSKYYSVYFLLLHFTATNIFIFFYQNNKKDIAGFTKFSAAGYCIIIAGIAPWVYLLAQRYGTPMLNYTGKINASWYLNGHRTFKDGLIVLLPPAVNNGYNFWEDPIAVEGGYHYFWQSKFLFARQLFLLIRNTKVFFEILCSFSPIVPFIYAFILFKCCFRRNLNKTMICSLFVFLFLPLGYIFIHIEARFLLLIGIMAFGLGFFYLQQDLLPQIRNVFFKKAIVLGYILSFSIVPIYDLIMAPTYGNKIVATAQQINRLSIKGTYITNNINASTYIQSYLIKMPLYAIEDVACGDSVLNMEINRYKIDYYIQDERLPHLLQNSKNRLIRVDKNMVEGFSIFKIE